MALLLNPCSEVPTFDTPSGEGCVNELANEYKFSRILGKGEEGGIVFEVIKDQHVMAVKVRDFDEASIKEVETQCMLNSMRNKTGVFAKAYGWQVCDELPSQWSRYLPNTIDIDDPLFIFMEKTIKEWKDVNLEPEEYKAILFLLIHGLYVARKAFGFSHDDIHTENVMLQPASGTVSVQIENGPSFAIPGLRFVPKLIDFGLSLTGKEEEEDSEEEDGLFASGPTPSTDMGSIALIYSGKFKSFFDSREFAIARQSGQTDYGALETLLRMDLFKEYRTDDKENTLRCSVCSAEHSGMRWKGKGEDYVFCSVSCGNYWGRGIGKFIK